MKLGLCSSNSVGRRTILALLALAVFLPVVEVNQADAGIFSDTITIRYRMTVVVDTPEGVKTGTAVREAGAYSEMRILPQQGGTHYNVTEGEAIPIDLGKRGFLFSAITPEKEARTVVQNLRNATYGEKVTVDPSTALFIQFQNINDPLSAREVCTPESCSAIAKSYPKGHEPRMATFEDAYGPGVSVKEVTVEISTDDVTRGIEKLIPWLPQKLKTQGTLTADNPRKKPFSDPTGLYLGGDAFVIGRSFK